MGLIEGLRDAFSLTSSNMSEIAMAIIVGLRDIIGLSSANLAQVAMALVKGFIDAFHLISVNMSEAVCSGNPSIKGWVLTNSRKPHPVGARRIIRAERGVRTY